MLADHVHKLLNDAGSSIRRADRTSFGLDSDSAFALLTTAVGDVVSTAEIDAAHGRAELLIAQFRGEWQSLGFAGPGARIVNARDAALTAIDDLAQAMDRARPSAAAAPGYASQFDE
jgi:hypothetical protein